jgi:hypothetical protein
MGVVVVAVIGAVIVGRVMGDGPGVPRDVAGVLVCAHRLPRTSAAHSGTRRGPRIPE